MNKNLFKNTIIIGIGTVCTKLLSLIMVPFYTIWLLPAEYGEYDLLVSYLSLMVPFITLQLEQALFKWCLTKKEDNQKILYNGFRIIIINILIVDLFCYIFLHKENYLMPFIFYFNSYAIFVYLVEYLRGQNKLKHYSMYNIMVSILTTILSIIFVPILKFGMIGLLCAFGISYATINLIIIMCEKILSNFSFSLLSQKTSKEMVKYSLPLIPNAISWWVTNASDRTMIKFILGNFFNGLYAVSCKIPTIISMIYGIFNLSWQQEAIVTYKDSDRDNYYNKVFASLISCLFSGSTLIMSMLPIFFKYFISSEYKSAIYVTPYLIIGSIFLSLAQFIGGILLAEDSTKKIGYTTAVAAIVNLLVNIIFMKKFGLIIAGISTAIAYIYFFINRYMLVKVLHSKKHIKTIILYSLLLIIVTYISLTVKNIIINLMLILLLCVFCFIANRELIKTIVKKVLHKA